MKQLFYIFVAALLIGCADGVRKPETVSSTTPYDSIMQAESYDVLPIFKTRTGHITVSIRVNGRPCVFLVDTGGGATLIDISKKDKFHLEPQALRDYAAGIGSSSPLVRTAGVFGINGTEIRNDSLFLMDISYVNAEFRKNRSRQVDGVLGTDFLEKHHAIVDYSRSTLYLKINPDATGSLWNFTKFLISKDGETIKRYAPTTEPKDFEKDIEELL